MKTFAGTLLLLVVALPTAAVEKRQAVIAPTVTPTPASKRALEIPAAMLSDAARYKNLHIGATGGFQALRSKLILSEKARVDGKSSAVRIHALRLLATPPPPSCPTPTIQAVLSDSPVSPGEEIVLNGCGFGSAKPHVRLMGQFPNGFLELEIVPPWKDHVLVAKMPAVTGVNDQPANITVVRSDFTIGNQVALGFQATRDLYWLTADDLIVGCSEVGHCVPMSIPDGTTPGTMGGYHQIDQTAPVIRVDTMQVHLLNGWTLYNYEFETADGFNLSDLAFAAPPSGFAAGAANATINVISTLIGHSAIRWGIFIFAIGPSGVRPH
jgi:hypothetical protein